MKWTEEKIQALSSKDYLLYRDEIRRFYNKRVTQKKIPKKEKKLLKDLSYLYNLTDYQKRCNIIYWNNHSDLKGIKIYFNNPWKKFYKSAKNRCTCISDSCYIDYGFVGIQCKFTEEDVKRLWFRDCAWNMQEPSIDRKDSLYHYIYENCQFLELEDNLKKAREEYHYNRSRRNLDPNGDWTQLETLQKFLK